MKTASSSSCVENLGVIGCGIIGIFLCGVGAGFGATATGQMDGPFLGLGAILFFIFGCLGGAVLIVIISLILSARGKSYSPFLVSVIIAPVAAMLISAVSIPILIFIDAKSSERRQEIRETSKKKYDLLYDQLQRNPEIAFEENWASGDYEHALVFEASWPDENVPYTLDQLKRIYAANPRAVNIFHHPSCTTEFLVSHYEDAYEDAFLIDHSKLEAIVSNPKTPRELIQKVADSETLPVGAVYPARHTLKKLDEK